MWTPTRIDTRKATSATHDFTHHNSTTRPTTTPDIDVVVEAPSSPKTTTFAELGVRDEIVRALAEGGIEHTFAIQELTLPLALAGDDLIGQARTGMGKTFAFGVPLLHRITTDADAAAHRHPRARSSSCPPASCACRSTTTSPTPRST